MGVIHIFCKIHRDHFGNDTITRNMVLKDSHARCEHNIDPGVTSACEVQLQLSSTRSD